MRSHLVEPPATPTEPSGFVFNTMRFSVHDGPGIRTTVFLKGCPLSCWWCHNPESRDPQPRLIYLEARCVRCGDCIAACPEGNISSVDGAICHSSLCRACGTCADACPAGARELVGRRMSVAEVLRQIERDRVFYDESGGGVTFSGGEPLVQPEFLEALLDACRQMSIRTAVDTCGFAKRELLLRLSEKIDLFLYDLKLIDAAKHQQYIGVSNVLILSNLEALARDGRAIIVRVPVIPGVNDDDENVGQLAEFLSRIGMRRVDLLPYHQTGIHKYQRLRQTYRLEGLQPPSAERVQQIVERLKRDGFTVRIGG